MMRKTLRLSDGAQVGYIEAGLEAERGEALVLLHGVGMRAEAWGPQIATFANSNRVIALDMPGHGQSAALPGQPELGDYVAWTAKVLRQLGARANVAGHSMGALMAAGLAVDNPDLVLRLAVLNGVYRRSPEAKAAVQARAAALAKGANDIDVPLARWFGPKDQAVRDQVADWLRGMDMKGYAAAYRAFAHGDATYAEAWPHLHCPTLVLTGDGDANSTPEMARSMAQAAPDARAVVIENHRHMVNLTAPKAVNAAIAAWLAAPVLNLKEGMRA